MSEPEPTLRHKTIAIPESRQQDVLAELLIRRGASVLRCPLIAIKDSPETDAVQQWMEAMIAGNFDDFIILTGEGLRRLDSFAERLDCQQDWHRALAGVRKIVRGPKPVRELRKLQLHADLAGAAPTSDGIMESLKDADLTGRRIAVQLYGSNPNKKLINFLRDKGAEVSTVAPYIYASESEQQQVVTLIHQLAGGGIDALLFTSQPQYKRLATVAKKEGLEMLLTAGLEVTVVGAIGPVMADYLRQAGVRVDFMPEGSFFMKPFVTALGVLLADH
ncbi:MAG: uroporphyrinogen-III synthase [Gammaproteobacteria bacterium]|nr:uroporphyrinogen-III synthase [Gammaproteobacteria bacterium]MBQ0840560.1 uroporphyrinogen-III synthase [Gammaproteobacteria bacterium]